MENEVTIYNEKDLIMAREPQIILEEARKAAKALDDVISRKKNKVIINNEQYLEFEDWLTVARFYGISTKIVSTNPISFENIMGFEARAVAILVKTGEEISAAEAMCLNDEKNWKDKPLFMLRSMAQTRACAKVLRNVLAWVVVLAGYKPTPAEEMNGIAKAKGPTIPMPQEKKPESEKPQDMKIITTPIDKITQKGGKKRDGSDYIKYTLYFQDKGYSTFSKTIAEDAKKALDLGLMVNIEFRDTQYGPEIVSLEFLDKSGNPNLNACRQEE